MENVACMTDSEKLDLILSEMFGMKNDISGMKTEIADMKNDISGMKTEIADMKNDISGMKTEIVDMKKDISGMKTEIADIKTEISDIKIKIDTMQIDVTSINLTLENETRVNIQRIAEGHLDLARNLKDSQKPSQEMEVLTLRVNTLEREVGEIRRRIS